MKEGGTKNDEQKLLFKNASVSIDHQFRRDMHLLPVWQLFVIFGYVSSTIRH